ncbi:MAG: Na+/H+ antiporter NhaA [Rhodopirellula sp.]|nr:Na+/H+ antiporter NhaA [Rhodopirellula sp.]
MPTSSGKAELPEGVGWVQLCGIRCLAGIGFTMSLFVSELAFASQSLTSPGRIFCRL